MKKPEEIKKGLECCFKGNQCKGHCPYNGPGHGIFQCTSALAKDALAYIQQLEAQVPRWIPVEERLPENYATVIIFREDCRNACIGWLIGGSWSVPKGVRVTHWMPLPEAPKEDAHENS